MTRPPGPIPSDVLAGLAAVRADGSVSMRDWPMVAFLARELGYPATADWVERYRETYAAPV